MGGTIKRGPVVSIKSAHAFAFKGCVRIHAIRKLPFPFSLSIFFTLHFYNFISCLYSSLALSILLFSDLVFIVSCTGALYVSSFGPFLFFFFILSCPVCFIFLLPTCTFFFHPYYCLIGVVFLLVIYSSNFYLKSLSDILFYIFNWII